MIASANRDILARTRERRQSDRLDRLAFRVNGAVVNSFLAVAGIPVVSVTISRLGSFEFYAVNMLIAAVQSAEDKKILTTQKVGWLLRTGIPTLGLMPDTPSAIRAALLSTVPSDLDLNGYNVRLCRDRPDDCTVQIVRADAGGTDIRSIMTPFRSLEDMFRALVMWGSPRTNGHSGMFTGQQALCLFQRAAKMFRHESGEAGQASPSTRPPPAQLLLIPPEVRNGGVSDPVPS